jgi:2-hydroxy-3-keto-5-methylthiopentenyl-1-phosphate phosphatase
LIVQLNRKKRMAEQGKEINKEIKANQEEKKKFEKEKINIEQGFKDFIQKMNEDATLKLREFEENMKVKEICRIMRGKN